MYLYGSGVIEGIGNCKNINSMLRDLLRENGYSSYNLSMLLDNKVIELNQKELLHLDNETNSIDKLELECINEFSKFEEFVFNLIVRIIDPTNHVVTLFTDDIHSYVMDATNDTLFLVDDKLNLYQDKYKFDKCYESMYNEDEKQNLNKILKPSSIQLLSSRLCDYENVWNSCFELTDIFEKFYKEHKDLYIEVAEKSKTLKKEYDKYNIFRK